MKNQTNDGLYCDYCGAEAKLDFTYYSFDFFEVKVVNHFARKQDAPALSVDVCETCMELFRQRLLKVSELPPASVRCDITGADFESNDLIYYKCIISRVRVDISHQPYTCACGKQKDPQDGPCDCGASTLTKNAELDIDDEYLELNFCSGIFNKFKSHTDHIQNLGDTEWTSK